MGMRISSIAIIVTDIPQVNFKNFAQFFQKVERFINGCQTHCWKLNLDFIIELRGAGMIGTVSYQVQ